MSVSWVPATAAAVNPLLARSHYLGPLKSGRLIFAGIVAGKVAGAMVWRLPTSRRLPSDGSWLELSRWCLTPELGANAGSQAHKTVTRQLRELLPELTTLVSYSDPSAGHTGALYRACNWVWSPTWHRLRPPPTGQGSWQPGKQQAVKDRWLFLLRRDTNRAELVSVRDAGAIRAWRAVATPAELRLAAASPALDLAEAAR